jgi:uncharacterized protein (DUF58 family)
MCELRLPTQGGPALLERVPAGGRFASRILVRRTSSFVGARRSSSPAAQGEFNLVRPYEAGDSLRQLNWKATASTGSLQSNSFYAELSPELVLALDLGPWGLSEAEEGALLELGRAAALALADGLLSEKARVALALLGEFPACFPLGSGRRHLEEIRSALFSAARPAERPPAGRYAATLGRAYRPRTTVLLISPLVDDAMFSFGYLLRRQGLHTFIVSPSPSPLAQRREAPGNPDTALAYRLMRLGRVKEQAEAWQWGPVVDWEEYDSLGKLASLFQARGAGGSRNAG